MPRTLEVLDQTVRRLERGEASALEAIDILLAEEFTLRESRRVKTALRMARLSTIKTLAGFDFSFQPSLDRNRILALAQLDFIDRNEVIHFLGRPAQAKATSPSRLASRLRRPDVASTSPPLPTSSAHSPRLSVKGNCVIASASSAEPRF
jgi:IstB-like ATP binding protein